MTCLNPFNIKKQRLESVFKGGILNIDNDGANVGKAVVMIE